MNELYSINIRKILKIVLFAAGIVSGVFVALKVSVYIAPFIIAFIIASLIEPIVKLLVLKVRIPRKFSSAIVLFLVLSTFGLIVTLIVSKIIAEIVSLSYLLPVYYTKIYDNSIDLIDKCTEIYLGLPVEVTKNIQNILSGFSNSLMDMLNSVLKGIYNTATAIPQALIFILVTILSSFFLSSDRERIYNFFYRQFPEHWTEKVLSIKRDMFSAMFGYIRAQLILMTITFTELSIGFNIIGLKHPFVIASIISVIDALPILGTGGILIPWAVYELITRDIRMAVSLIIIYGIVLVVRQLTEPKILSHQIGLHPLITLPSMYVGLQLFGVAGLILGPITALLIKNILVGILKGRTIKEVWDNSLVSQKNKI